MTINNLIKRLEQLRDNDLGDTDIVFHPEHNALSCGDFTLLMDKNKLKNICYCCYRCKHDPRILSKDKKHKLCSKICAEVTIEECEKIINNEI